MKIKQFIAKDVHGYISYDISFFDDINFIIGLNGCGKTTTLKLISGLLLPNYNYLAMIDFSYIELKLEHNSILHIVSCKKEKQSIKMIFDEEKPSTFPLVTSEEINMAQNDGYISPQLNAVYRSFEKSEIMSKIRGLTNPIILGLSRRLPIFRNRNNDEIIRRSHQRNINIGEVDLALLDIRELMFTKVRQNARQQDFLTTRFREDLLKETLRFSDIKTLNMYFSGKFNYQEEVRKLNAREIQINKIMSNLGIPELTSSMVSYFNEAKNLLSEIDTIFSNKVIDENKKMEQVSPLLIKWVLNGSQLEKIDKIAELGNKYSDNIADLNSCLIRLKNSLNMFFNETNKNVEISGDGNLEIIMPNGDRNSMFDLSSGEKQLIIMFGHLALSTSDEDGIFIIDEPELSLHLSWQEKFVKALLEANPKTQFILATHAPAIVNETSMMQNCINLSKVNK